jgi:ribosomal protein S12 methylthiotransferase accessory factor
VPTSFCYYDYPQKNAEAFCWADSNGNAAGNTIEEAILQGFLELVERDSVAIWWYNRLLRPEVDLKSFCEPYFEKLEDYFASINRKFWVLDLTTDLKIPTFAAISCKMYSKVEEIAFGFGAHFDAKLALTQALTEMPQLMPRLDGQPMDNQHSYHDPELSKWWRTATVEQHDYLLPDASQKRKTPVDYAADAFKDLRDYVNQSVNIAQLHGMEVLVLDQTRPDVGLPVVKVIVPGLRHFWARFAPGRLYDVPVRQGWLRKKKRESDLNKVHLFV